MHNLFHSYLRACCVRGVRWSWLAVLSVANICACACPPAFISCVICFILLNMIKLHCRNTLSLLALFLSFAGFFFIQPVSINAAEPPVKKPLTLKQAVEKGIGTNPEVQGSLYSFKATEKELRQAQASYFPQVDLSGDIGSEYTRDPITQSDSGQNLMRRRITVQITQQLFDGFDTKYEVRRQTNRIDSASFDIFDISEQTSLDIIEAFLDVIRQRELLRISQENVDRKRPERNLKTSRKPCKAHKPNSSARPASCRRIWPTQKHMIMNYSHRWRRKLKRQYPQIRRSGKPKPM